MRKAMTALLLARTLLYLKPGLTQDHDRDDRRHYSRYYDRDHRDYHEWNEREERAWHRYWRERRGQVFPPASACCDAAMMCSSLCPFSAIPLSFLALRARTKWPQSTPVSSGSVFGFWGHAGKTTPFRSSPHVAICATQQRKTAMPRCLQLGADA